MHVPMMKQEVIQEMEHTLIKLRSLYNCLDNLDRLSDSSSYDLHDQLTGIDQGLTNVRDSLIRANKVNAVVDIQP